MNRETIHHVVTIVGSLPVLGVMMWLLCAEPDLFIPQTKGFYGDMWKVLWPSGISGIICLVNGVAGLMGALSGDQASR